MDVDKLVFIANYIEKNELINNIDLLKFVLKNTLSVSKKIYSDNTINEDCELNLNPKIFETLLKILINLNNDEIASIVIEILLFFSLLSTDFSIYCIKNLTYIKYLTDLFNNNKLFRDIIVIIDNIVNNENCTVNCFEIILEKIDILKSILSKDNTTDIILNILELLYSIINKINETHYEKYFLDCIDLFGNLFSVHAKNKDIVKTILQICAKLSVNSNICQKIISSPLESFFYKILKVTNLKKEYLSLIVEIFSNLFSNIEVNMALLKKYNNNIIDIFTDIIMCYNNKNDSNNNKLLSDIIFCMSNLVIYDISKNYVINSFIPKLIIEIMNKNYGDIYFEGLNFLFNLMSDCDKDAFVLMTKLQVSKLFIEGINCSKSDEEIEICLLGIKNLLMKEFQFYKEYDNIKFQILFYLPKEKMNELALNKNKTISDLAEELLLLYKEGMK